MRSPNYTASGARLYGFRCGVSSRIQIKLPTAFHKKYMTSSGQLHSIKFTFSLCYVYLHHFCSHSGKPTYFFICSFQRFGFGIYLVYTLGLGPSWRSISRVLMQCSEELHLYPFSLSSSELSFNVRNLWSKLFKLCEKF